MNKKETKEWEMVVELYEMIGELDTYKQKKFIKSLFDNLDPFLSFLEQQSETQEAWLNQIYNHFCNDEPYEEFYE